MSDKFQKSPAGIKKNEQKIKALRKNVEVPQNKQLSEDTWGAFVKEPKNDEGMCNKVSALFERTYANEVRRAQAFVALARALALPTTKGFVSGCHGPLNGT